MRLRLKSQSLSGMTSFTPSWRSSLCRSSPRSMVRTASSVMMGSGFLAEFLYAARDARGAAKPIV